MDVNKEAKVSTLWDTKNLWLRRTFTIDKTAKETLDVIFDIFHDDDVEVYLNGVRILSVSGWNRRWEEIAVTPKEFFAAARPGKNTLAVKATQYAGEQYIDMGLRLEVRK